MISVGILSNAESLEAQMLSLDRSGVGVKI
jgi:hypothetical protein